MNAPPRVSILMVTYNARADALRSLQAAERHAGPAVEILLVDNASTDGTPQAVREQHPAVRLSVNAENVGFARANNQALAQARAAYVLLLNPDAELQPGTLQSLVNVLEARPDVGWVGPRTQNGDGTPQVSFGPRLTLRNEWRQRRLVAGVRTRSARALALAERAVATEHEPDWVSAACALARTEALRSVGGFDERFFLYEEDVDLCLRLRAAGWRILHFPEAVVVHQLGRSMDAAPARARLEYQRSHVRYYLKHHGRAQILGLRLVLMTAALTGLVLARDTLARELQRQLLRIAVRGS